MLEVATTTAAGGKIEMDPDGDPRGLSGMRAIAVSQRK
jgi:hypothetical protein